ncbi:MAG: immunoglobulin-like domain-containing protein [Minisyncoccia bacterium]|jgi:hypothetical protein
MDPIFEKNLITTKYAGELSGYTPDYLARLARSGKIAGKRIGHSWLIDSESLTHFLDQQGDRKADYARALARAREVEYREYHSLLRGVGKTLSTPFTVPSLNIGESSLRSQIISLSVAFLVVMFGAFLAHATPLLQFATETMTVAREAASGFNATFGDIPSRIALRINTVSTEMRIHPSYTVASAVFPSARSASPFLADLNLSSFQHVIISKNIFIRSTAFAFVPNNNVPLNLNIAPARILIFTVGNIQASLFAVYAFIATPSRVANAFASTYIAVGNETYAAIIASLSDYHLLIEHSGIKTLAYATVTRDAFAIAPHFIDQANLAFGNLIITTTHAAIRADVATAYGLSAALPASAHVALALVVDTGDVLAGATARSPALAIEAYLRATGIFAACAPALAQAVFAAEYTGASHFVALINAASRQYLEALMTTGHLALTLRSFSEAGYASTVNSITRAPAALEDFYLGVLGKSAYAFNSLFHLSKATNALAAAAPTLSVGEQIALITYETIHGFLNSTSSMLATLFGPPPSIVMPATVAVKVRTSAPVIASTTLNTSRITVTNYPTYTTVVNGASEDFVNQSLASLRNNVLATVAGMIQPVTVQTATNENAIQQVNMIQDLSNLIVRNGDFRGGTLSGAASVSATSGSFNNLTAGGLSLGSLDGPLQANSGVVSATTSIGVLYGGTGLSIAPAYGQLLVGDTNGEYVLTATSSLGINSGIWGKITGSLSDQTDLQSALNAKLSLTDWFATTSAPQLTTLANLINATTTNLNIGSTITGAGLASCSGATSKLLWNSSTGRFTCGVDAGSSGSGITGLGAEYSPYQTDATQTFATSSDMNIGLIITSNSDIHTFTPIWIGTLADNRIASASNWNSAYNNEITSASYPLSISSNAISSAFGTTTTIGVGTNKLLAVDSNGIIIASSTIGNGQLQNNSITVTTASPLGGAGTIPLGGTLALTCAGCLTSLAGAASSTLLSDANTFSGINNFTNSSSNFSGTWQTFAPSHFSTFAYPFPNSATSSIVTFSSAPVLASLSGLIAGNTGTLYQVATSTISFGYASTTQIGSTGSAYFATSGGNVGVGTTSPYALLSIGGNVVIGASTAGGTLGNLTLPALGTPAGAFLAVNSNGQVIATTTSYSMLPQINAGYILGNNTGNTANVTSFATSTLFGASSYGNVLMYGSSVPAWAATSTLFSGTTGQFPYFSASGTLSPTSSIFLSGSNIGIGTTSPYAQLSISNSVTSPVNQTLFSIASTTAGTSTSTLMTVLANGNVGIGTATPNNTIQVTNLINFDNINYNTALGYQAGLNVVSGPNQGTFVGYQAGMGSSTASDSGTNNAAVGYQSLYSNTSGSYNSAEGYGALYFNTTGSFNSAHGEAALYNNTSGSYNSAEGYEALFYNSTGNSNSAQGYNALSFNTTGLYSSALGANAGTYISGGSTANLVSNSSLFLGYNSMALASGDTNEIVIGASATGIGSNTVTLGNSSILTTALKGKVGIGTTTPDQKLSIYSAATPSLEFSLGAGAGNQWTEGIDTTNGNSFEVASSSALGTNPRFVVNGSGNIGIGTTSPYALLSIGGNVVIGASTAGGTLGTLTLPALGTVTGTFLAVNGTGTVIATTTPLLSNAGNWAGTWQSYSPSNFSTFAYPFPSNATSTFLTFSGGLSTTYASTTAVSGTSLCIGTDCRTVWPTGGGSVGSGTTGQFPYYAGAGSTLTATSSIFLASNGFIGIGTTSPQGLLDVVGNSNSVSTAFTGARAMSIINTDTTNGNMAGFDFRTDDLAGTLTTGTKILAIFNSHTASHVSADMTFRTNNAGTIGEVMRLTSTGNVGIGTTSPSSLLSISNSATTAANTPLFTIASTTGGTATTTLFSISSQGQLQAPYYAVAAGTFLAADASGRIIATTTPTGGSGSGTVGSGTTGQFPYYAAGGTTLTATSSLFLAANGYVGIGTGSPGTLLDVEGGNINIGTGNAYQIGAKNAIIASSAANNWFFGNSGNLSTSGTGNTGEGETALLSLSSGASNTANGYGALYSNTSGSNNTANGFNALYNDALGSNSTAIGYQAGNGAGGTSITSSTLLGYGSGYSLGNSTGNILLGYQAGYDLATGSNNIVIGYNTDLPSTTQTSTLDIANLIYATGLTNFLSPSSAAGSGYVGIGTTSPYSLLSISNSATTAVNTPLFTIASTTGGTATSTLFSVGSSGLTTIGDSSGTGDANFQFASDANAWDIGYNSTDKSFDIASSTSLSNTVAFTIAKGTTTNNVGIGTTSPNTALEVHGEIRQTQCTAAGALNADASGDIICSVSSERFKHNIQSLTSADGLAEVDALTPVSFVFNPDMNMGSSTQVGFIAEQADLVDPRLVSVDGTGQIEGFRYDNYTAILTEAVQELDARTNWMEEATSTAGMPPDVLTVDGKSVDLYKLATYNLASVQTLAAAIDAQNIRLTSLEARVTALENGVVSTTSGSPITLSTSTLASALNGFGALIQKGIAQFGILVADQFVAATNSAGTSSAGTVTILAGNTVAQVNNAYVLPSSKIFVTLTASTTGSWYISDKQNGSFRFVLSTPQPNDVSFDYFLVQTEGQIATSTPNGSSGSETSASSDTTPPTITLLGDNPMHISVGDEFVDPGVSVADNADGTDPYITYINGIQQAISSTTIDTSSPTTYLITYKATDAAGNNATAMRSVIVGNPDGTVSTGAATSTTTSTTSTVASSDTIPPVVTLIGDAAMQINVGDTFTDPGATATDTIDGDLTAKIVETGAVDATTAGLYTLTYSATDAAGNTASVSRVVTVVASTTPIATTTTQ